MIPKLQDIDVKYVHSELSHNIIGACYEIQNEIGCGRPEKTYQKALAMEFIRRGLKFKEQVVANLIYKREKLSNRRFDFVVEDKVVVELKVGLYLAESDFKQLNEYLIMSNLKLGLLVLFSNQGVKVRRVVNVN